MEGLKLKGEKMRVDVEIVEQIIFARWLINRLPFDKIEWYKDGKPMNIPQEILDEYKFTGLNNIDFVETEFLMGEEK